MATASTVLDAKIRRSPGKIGMLVFGIVLIVGFAYAGSHLLGDLSTIHNESVLPYVLLGVALLVALGFEFVNGFHPPPMQWRRSSIPTHWSLTWRWCGRVSGIFSE